MALVKYISICTYVKSKLHKKRNRTNILNKALEAIAVLVVLICISFIVAFSHCCVFT